jgi:hypothetical protein
MKIIITKKQYRSLVFTLLETLVGDLTIGESEDERYAILDQDGEEIIDIWTNMANGCKKDLTLSFSFSENLEGYVPYFRKKIFSEVLIEYVYTHTNIKCDCIDYHYGFTNDDDGTRSKGRYLYNLKKKKKIKSP